MTHFEESEKKMTPNQKQTQSSSEEVIQSEPQKALNWTEVNTEVEKEATEPFDGASGDGSTLER